MFGPYTKSIVTAAVYLLGILVRWAITRELNADELYIGIMGLANVLLVFALANEPRDERDHRA